ncbi:hypothetical protein FR483_n680L [Paramecium bursaria Chlorella virus FR483]|uniref:Uncharacterized protein n680L n=1 Tax=Paramecium bursaria Chlorella virus FR483 TaxID=399781 RepID=A7J834_PBCVF|nr:hypothetical protein FR483_n680L [Paramecium bursaria Chlorella virus FR483]ABT15965.1 hypothetical protein FR483_n680L [Paramecium bursaria Chlorella virus FR483]
MLSVTPKVPNTAGSENCTGAAARVGFITRGSAYVGGLIPLIVPSTAFVSTGTLVSKLVNGKSSSILFSITLAPTTTFVLPAMCSMGSTNCTGSGALFFVLRSSCIFAVSFLTDEIAFSICAFARDRVGIFTSFVLHDEQVGFANKYFASE